MDSKVRIAREGSLAPVSLDLRNTCHAPKPRTMVPLCGVNAGNIDATKSVVPPTRAGFGEISEMARHVTGQRGGRCYAGPRWRWIS